MINYDFAALVALLVGTLFILAGCIITISYLCKARKNGEEPVKAIFACDVVFHVTISLGVISFCICAMLAVFGMKAKMDGGCNRHDGAAVVLPVQETAPMEDVSAVAFETEDDSSASVKQKVYHDIMPAEMEETKLEE